MGRGNRRSGNNRSNRSGGRGDGGGRHRGRGGGGGRGRGRSSATSDPPMPRRDDGMTANGDSYVLTVTEQGNYRMEAYYAAQGLYNHCFDGNNLRACTGWEECEAERVRWRAAAAQVLPASFRIGKDVPSKLRDRLESELMSMVGGGGTKHREEKEEPTDNPPPDGPTPTPTVELVTKLPFLPHAYQLTHLDRAAIRKNPEHAQLHEWLKQQSSAGTITRQEAVSMIPPLVLAPQPHHSVLDMCAAPGSKTTQLLEDMGPDGCVVANDASLPRAHMLTTQLRRVLPSNPVAIVTHCNAQFFPSANVIQFDSILADVPCSGDGTMRKNINVWTSWSQMGALALHVLQTDIAWKGACQLLRPDGNGHLCYSTCSLNPVEDEAVVAELLRRSKGQLELVEARHVLGTFRTRPGLSTWKVFCDDRTRREARNHEKKNNEKMQQRRKEYEASQQQGDEKGAPATEEAFVDDGATKSSELQNGEGDGGGEEEVKEEDQVNDDLPTDAAAKNDEAIVAEDPNDGVVADPSQASNAVPTQGPPAAERKRFAPTTYDPEELIRLVESTGMKHYATPDDVPEHLQKRVRPSVFPPTPEEAAQFHLDRCIRCLPHDNDTGGFFVALLRKKGPISPSDHHKTQGQEASPKESGDGDDVDEQDPKRIKLDDSPLATEGDGIDLETANEIDTAAEGDEVAALASGPEDGRPAPPKRRSRDKRNLMRDADGNAIPDLGRDDFVPVSDDVLQPLVDFYGLSPTLDRNLLMIRAGSESKVISYIAPSVKKLFDAGLQSRVTIVTSGLKVLIRKGQDSSVAYRLSHEGLPFLAPHMGKRKLVVNRQDFESLLSGDVVPFSSLSEDLQSRLAPLAAGSMAIVLEGSDADGDGTPMMLAKWRCRADKVDNLVPKVDLQAMKDRIDAMLPPSMPAT